MAKTIVYSHERPFVIEIALSERNLLSLLSKLYEPDSLCTITNNVIDDGAGKNIIGNVAIRAEKDDVHYADPARRGSAPGQMSPKTERIVKLLQKGIEEIEREENPTEVYSI